MNLPTSKKIFMILLKLLYSSELTSVLIMPYAVTDLETPSALMNRKSGADWKLLKESEENNLKKQNKTI